MKTLREIREDYRFIASERKFGALDLDSFKILMDRRLSALMARSFISGTYAVLLAWTSFNGDLSNDLSMVLMVLSGIFLLALFANIVIQVELISLIDKLGDDYEQEFQRLGAISDECYKG